LNVPSAFLIIVDNILQSQSVLQIIFSLIQVNFLLILSLSEQY